MQSKESAGFSSFLTPDRQRINTAVIGATGGIGSAFIDALTTSQDVATTYALARQPIANRKTIPLPIDITSEDSISSAAGKITDPLHILIIATGTLHQPDAPPEKNTSQLNAPQMLQNFTINSIGPALILKHFMPLMDKAGKSVIAALSARVGSISDNGTGGWYSYRASKAALNMLIKSAAIEHSRKHTGGLIIGLHPGTVATPLSDPFTARLPAEKLFTPAQSVSQMLNVIDATSREDSGACLAYDGTKITS